jgi:hypothetical protein
MTYRLKGIPKEPKYQMPQAAIGTPHANDVPIRKLCFWLSHAKNRALAPGFVTLWLGE